MSITVSKALLTFQADHPGRLAMSYLLYQQLKTPGDTGAHPLLGYDSDEVLISGPELIIASAGLLITPSGRVTRGGVQSDVFSWNHRVDIAFATIAPMLQGIMFLSGGLGSSLVWRWKFRHGELRETARRNATWEKEHRVA